MVDSGHIAIDVELADAALVGGAQSQKVISLKKTTEYASGKVAVVTGTCGATRLTINPSNLAYRDAAHNQVTFTSIRRIVLQADPGALFYRGFFALPFGCSRGEPCVLSDTGDTLPSQGYAVSAVQGTATGITSTFTLIFYGE